MCLNGGEDIIAIYLNIWDGGEFETKKVELGIRGQDENKFLEKGCKCCDIRREVFVTYMLQECNKECSLILYLVQASWEGFDKWEGETEDEDDVAIQNSEWCFIKFHFFESQ